MRILRGVSLSVWSFFYQNKRKKKQSNKNAGICSGRLTTVVKDGEAANLSLRVGAVGKQAKVAAGRAVDQSVWVSHGYTSESGCQQPDDGKHIEHVRRC